MGILDFFRQAKPKASPRKARPRRPGRPTATSRSTGHDQASEGYRSVRLDQATAPVDQSGAQVKAALDRIEERVKAIHDQAGLIKDNTFHIKEHTTLLVDRVPSDLRPLLAEVKELLLSRLKSSYEGARVEHRAAPATKPVDQGEQPKAPASEEEFLQAFERLSAREKHLIQQLHEHGFLTYRELAERVGLNPTTVKNMVNTMLQNPLKAGFIAKTKHPVQGAQVGISELLRDAILWGKKKAKVGK